jgi:hypothetical protein
MVRELLTREDFYDAILSGEGVVVVTDVVRGRTALRRNGRYYRAASFSEARRDLDADPCHCS